MFFLMLIIIYNYKRAHVVDSSVAVAGVAGLPVRGRSLTLEAA
jgi:hypothetical protein